MNEQYKLLAQRAVEEFNKEHMFATVIVPDELREKYAELIIRECMDVVSSKCASPTAYQALAEHFGIEL